MRHGTRHRRSVIRHIAVRSQIEAVQRNPDPFGLRLQQRRRNAVHRRTPRRAVDGRQQRDDLVVARPHRPPERMGGILAAAPVENRPYPFHTICPALWKNPQTSVRYSGIRPSTPHFNSMPKSSRGRAADVESARFERRTHPIGMTARIPVGTGTTAFRTMETGADIGERTAADAPLHIEQPCFDPLALGTHQSACLRQGQSLLLRHDLRSDDERRRIARQILLDGEPEGADNPSCSRNWGRRGNIPQSAAHRGNGRRNRPQAAQPRNLRHDIGMKNSYGKISRSGGSKRDFSKKISSFRTVFRTQSLYLPQIWSSVRSQNDGMKRESGANPGQSRCCEAPRRYEHLSHWSARIGKASETGVSQKTCQIDSTSENLVDRVSDSGCKSHRLPERRSFSCSFPRLGKARTSSALRSA